MLQSEFFDRTHVSLSAEEYGNVENIYNRLQMNKDEFCKLWLDNRDNKIIAELMQYVMRLEKVNASLEKVGKEFDEKMAKELVEKHEHFLDFGRKIIANIDDESRLYDICEEEFTLDFICKVKLEEDIDLEEHERKHLLQKL